MTMYYNKLDCINIETKQRFTVWQKIENNALLAYVDSDDQSVTMPKIYEATVVETDLEYPL